MVLAAGIHLGVAYRPAPYPQDDLEDIPDLAIDDADKVCSMAQHRVLCDSLNVITTTHRHKLTRKQTHT